MSISMKMRLELKDSKIGNIKMSSPRVVLCIPGTNFTREFVINLIQFTQDLSRAGIQFTFSMHYDPVIHFVRAKCLGGDARGGANQKPFQGRIPFDYVLWIDSDIMFTYKQFELIWKQAQTDINKYQVVSGWYSMSDGKNTTAVIKMSDEDFIAKGHYTFITNDEMCLRSSPFPVDYTGMGFMLIHRNTLEKITYPWFYAPVVKIGDFEDMMSEDVAFCKKIRLEAKEKIWIVPQARVGHQKLVVL